MEKKNSHLGAGLAAGLILGVATGLFLQSKKGKELSKEAQKKALLLQKQVMKRLEQAQDLSKEKYDEIVEQVLVYYTKSKDIAAKEVPVVRKFLLSRWKAMEAYLKAPENNE